MEALLTSASFYNEFFFLSDVLFNETEPGEAVTVTTWRLAHVCIPRVEYSVAQRAAVYKRSTLSLAPEVTVVQLWWPLVWWTGTSASAMGGMRLPCSHTTPPLLR